LRPRPWRTPLNSSWIAATAIAHGLPLVSRDADYDDVPGLHLIRV
jgi:predicted nucleic acid-binding protein